MTTKERDTILKDKEVAELMLTDKQAADMLGVKVTTLQQYVSRGLMITCYTNSPVNNKRFWYKTKLMGL